MVTRFNFRYTLLIRLSDVLLVILALLLSYRMRVGLDIGRPAPDELLITPPILYILAIALWQLIFQLLEVYRPRYAAWLWTEVQRILLAHGTVSLAFFGILYLAYRDYSRLEAIYFITLMLVLTLAYRVALRIMRKAFNINYGVHRTVLIVGTDANAARIGKTVSLYSWTGLTLLGYLKHHPDDKIAEDVGTQVLGIVDDLPLLVEDHRVNEVVFVLKTPDYAYLSRMIDALQYQVTNIRLAPDYSDLAYFHVSTENFGGIPLIGLREAVLSPSQRAIKRAFDVVVASAAMIIGSPIFFLIAVAIKLESPGPAIYSQPRIGEHGRTFQFYKFRSMYDQRDPRRAKSNPGERPVDHKKAEDPRVTRVGRFLRRTSLDELPQFWNILKGDMSIVGPRPEMPWLVEKYEPWQRKRFEVPQGLTGWWQINGRADKPMYLNTEDDLFYIRNYSLWLDIQIIFRTILVVITGRGAY